MSEALEKAAPAEPSSGPAAGVRWDLRDLLQGADTSALDATLAEADAAAARFAERYRGRVAELDARALAEALDALERMSEPAARVANFAQLQFAADTSKPAHGALLQRVQEQASALRNQLVFFELEWLALPDAHVGRLLDEPALARRRHFLENLRRFRPHVLSEPEEKLLEELSNTGRRAFVRIFDETLAAQRFRIEHEGRTLELGEEELLALLYEASRELRREAAAALATRLREQSHLLSFVANTLVLDKSIEDRLRSHADPMAARNLANEIEPESVCALLDACERRYDLVQRYYRLKANLLGLERLKDYDRYAPVVPAEAERSFAEARRIVLEAYADFAPPMAEIAERFFEERWIDAELRSGKQGGAFSASTVPGVHPYVLLHYTGKLRDVMTLAHELGHGVHQYLAREQGLFEQDAPLTTAETASVFGEMLTFRRLMRDESDPRIRLGLLCSKLEDAFATVFRQVAMTRFEQALHAARRAEGELEVERINGLWLEANRAMFGDVVELTDDYGWSWLHVPHFVHTPFYCYAYAFGELLVLALVRRYDVEGPGFVPRYLELLRAGGSEAPSVLLGRLGLDVTDPEFWAGGLTLLEELLEQAEALASELR